VFAKREAQLLRRLDERLHGIVVGSRIFGANVALYTTLGSLAALGKLLDKVVIFELSLGSRLDKLLEELGASASLFDAGRQLGRGWQGLDGEGLAWRGTGKEVSLTARAVARAAARRGHRGARRLTRPLHAALFGPHGEEIGQICVVGLFSVQNHHGLAQNLLDARVATVAQDVLDGGYEFGIDVAGKGGAWVIGQDANEHDGIVLNMGSRRVLHGQILADVLGGDGSSGGRRLGSFDNDGQMEDLLALAMLSEVRRGGQRQDGMGSLHCCQGCQIRKRVSAMMI